MTQTLTEEQDIQTFETIEPETVLHSEPDILLPIDEYAERHGVSRRTVDRYVQTGRLEARKQRGRTMILDNPLKSPSQDMRQGQSDTDFQIVPLAQADWIQVGYLQARSKSKTLWQTYAIVATILLFAFILVSVCLFMQLRFLTAS